MKRIYLDNAASTPMDPAVIREITRTMTECPGNASSLHGEGIHAREILERSRSGLASILKCHSGEIIFTSGGTESNNLALKGFALANRNKGNHIIISSVEHDCILNTCRWLHRAGFRITQLPVDSEGRVDPDDLRAAIDSETILVSVMHVNNETGTIQPLNEIGRITEEYNIAFHTDACQSFGKIPVSPEELKADLISVNAHKIYGPKGVGALYIKKGISLDPLFHGGGQEQGLRSATENIPGIAGFVKAADLCRDVMEEDYLKQVIMRERLTNRLSQDFENVYFNGSSDSVPGIINFSFSGQEGEGIRLLLLLDEAGIAVSAGSACSSNHGGHSGSHVLQAIGRNPVEARGAIRVSTGRFNTMDDICMFCDILYKMTVQMKPIYSI